MAITKIDLSKMSGTSLPSGISTGQILQVVSTTKTDTFSSGHTATWTDVTGLSASITPASTSNKILVLVNINSASDVNSNNNFFRLVRGSTAINIGDSGGSRVQASAHIAVKNSTVQQMSSFSFLDSPSSSSATTYKIQFQTGNAGGGGVRINRGYTDTDATSRARTTSTVTLMEVAV